MVPDPNTFVRRSSLVLPITVRRFVERAHLRGADAIILDLEDSVAAVAKVAARALIRESVDLARRGGADVLVRVNNTPDLLDGDLDAAIVPGLEGIMLPKVESADLVRSVDERVTALERERGLAVGRTQFAVQIETARGLARAMEIAAASPRIVSLTLGPEDFCLDLDVEPSADGAEIAYANSQIILAARLAGVQPHGLAGTLGDYSHLEAFAASVRKARQLGFKGAGCIHPAQVPILNAVFAPTPVEVAHAQRVLATLAEAERQGLAAASLEGRMIDTPMATRARRLLARADAVETREASKRAALARPTAAGAVGEAERSAAAGAIVDKPAARQTSETTEVGE
ncbi:MAG: CoA ester lyase [Chloroflexi bacterium]|nr:CoA ester lyase [Chloroflexota bacterium]